MGAEKFIKKCETSLNRRIEKEIEKVEAKRSEYEGNVRDGFLRYNAPLQRAEDELLELEAYRNRAVENSKMRRENSEWSAFYDKFLTRLKELKNEYPGEAQILFVIDRIRHLYEVEAPGRR